jgi:tRNA (guanine26-N2/guanine27-N2)-dimethyltransferase
LCGVYPKAALRKYGGLALRTEYCQELAVRLLAGCLVTTAAKHDIGISIPLSHSSNHYVRVYGVAAYGARKADESVKKMGHIHHCFACFHRQVVTGILPAVMGECPECGAPLRTAGPLWTGDLAEREFCELVEKETARNTAESKNHTAKLLALIKDESDAPATYYVVDKICDKINSPIPPLRAVIRKLTEKGFRSLPTHFHSRGIRTNAPARAVIEAIRETAQSS